MSNPRHWWYGFIKRAIRSWGKDPEKTEPAYVMLNTAVRTAFEEVGKKEDAELQVKAINMVLIKCTHTIDGAALELNMSKRQIQRYVNAFVNRVGVLMGYDGAKR